MMDVVVVKDYLVKQILLKQEVWGGEKIEGGSFWSSTILGFFKKEMLSVLYFLVLSVILLQVEDFSPKHIMFLSRIN
jgi:hypothetical protein